MTGTNNAKKALLNNRTEFLFTEAEIGNTFADFALRCDDPNRAARSRTGARAAYDAVIHHSAKVALTDEAAHRLSKRLELLKSKLQRLGESFPS